MKIINDSRPGELPLTKQRIPRKAKKKIKLKIRSSRGFLRFFRKPIKKASPATKIRLTEVRIGHLDKECWASGKYFVQAFQIID